jgi:hypothetical protein
VVVRLAGSPLFGTKTLTTTEGTEGTEYTEGRQGDDFLAHFFLFGLGADEGAFFDARHVVGIGAVVVTTGSFLLVQGDQDAFVDGLGGQAMLLLLGTVAPDDLVGLAVFGVGSADCAEPRKFTPNPFDKLRTGTPRRGTAYEATAAPSFEGAQFEF